MKTKSNSSPGVLGPNKPRKCASVFQVCELEKTFETDPRPSHDKRIQLAKRLDMMPRTVQIWFQNRRAKARSQNHLMVKSVNCYTTAAATTDPINMRPLPFVTKPVTDLPYCFSPQDSLLNSQTFDQPAFDQTIDQNLINTLNSTYLPSPPDVTSPLSQAYYEYPYLRFGNGMDSWNLPFSYPPSMMDFNMGTNIGTNMGTNFMKSMSVGGMVGGMNYNPDLLPMTWSETYPQDFLSFPSQPTSDSLTMNSQDLSNINISL